MSSLAPSSVPSTPTTSVSSLFDCSEPSSPAISELYLPAAEPAFPSDDSDTDSSDTNTDTDIDSITTSSCPVALGFCVIAVLYTPSRVAILSHQYMTDSTPIFSQPKRQRASTRSAESSKISKKAKSFSTVTMISSNPSSRSVLIALTLAQQPFTPTGDSSVISLPETFNPPTPTYSEDE